MRTYILPWLPYATVASQSLRHCMKETLVSKVKKVMDSISIHCCRRIITKRTPLYLRILVKLDKTGKTGRRDKNSGTEAEHIIITSGKALPLLQGHEPSSEIGLRAVA
ncbi:hypothetical protein AVEN_67072-1 [Araneus ventricosus]|uniref:Uncharacterized protein n=1 Tax=Araneus ventricosus TaxID=182803 RepID=A0A4Y2W2P1_ARAVE|nr:hypothetical protein AVEN_67072-1 [Araneus ventricosus]